MKNVTLLGGAVLFALPVLAMPPTTPRVKVSLTASTVEFVANRRQWSSAVLFATDVPAGRLYLEHGRLIQALYDGKRVDELQHHADKTQDYQVKAHAYATTFVGASPQVAVRGEAKLPGYSNFFLGTDQAKWASGVPSFGGVRYQGLYPGVDLHFYGKNQTVEYDLSRPAIAVQVGVIIRLALGRSGG